MIIYEIPSKMSIPETDFKKILCSFEKQKKVIHNVARMFPIKVYNLSVPFKFVF